MARRKVGAGSDETTFEPLTGRHRSRTCPYPRTARRGWIDPGRTPVPFVTASFDVKFHRPTPLGPTVRLTAWPQDVDPSRIIVRSEVIVDDRLRASMTATWARFRPR
ncbi:MAG: PaaI family thioesterase [Acidimicrobiales bacterium]